jgi:hypothetical protein
MLDSELGSTLLSILWWALCCATCHVEHFLGSSMLFWGGKMGSRFHSILWWAVCCVERHDGRYVVFGDPLCSIFHSILWRVVCCVGHSWCIACCFGRPVGWHVEQIVGHYVVWSGAMGSIYHWLASWMACFITCRVRQFIGQHFVLASWEVCFTAYCVGQYDVLRGLMDSILCLETSWVACCTTRCWTICCVDDQLNSMLHHVSC